MADAPHILHVAAELSSGAVAFIGPALAALADAGARQTLLYAEADAARVDALVPPDAAVHRLALPLGDGSSWRLLRDALGAACAPGDVQAVHLHTASALLAGRLARLGALPGMRPPVLYWSAHGGAGAYDLPALAEAFAAVVARAPGLLPLQPVAGSVAEARRLARITGRTPVVLHHPVDAQLFAQARRPALPPRVIALGRACAAASPEWFAELAARFHFAREPARFVWVGEVDAPCVPLLRSAGVEFTGALAPQALAAELAAAHVVVLTARRHGITAPIVLAQSAGVPCVLTDVPGHRDLVRDGVTGLLADDVSGLALHVKALLDDPAEARRLGDAARRAAWRRFHPEAFGRALLALYRLPPAAVGAAPARQADAAALHAVDPRDAQPRAALR